MGLSVNLRRQDRRSMYLLKTFWGVGDKIASFYLRDIFWLGHRLDPQATVKVDYLLSL